MSLGQCNIYAFGVRATSPEGKVEEKILQRLAISPQMALHVISRACTLKWPGWKFIVSPVPENRG